MVGLVDVRLRYFDDANKSNKGLSGSIYQVVMQFAIKKIIEGWGDGRQKSWGAYIIPGGTVYSKPSLSLSGEIRSETCYKTSCITVTSKLSIPNFTNGNIIL